jgi:putative transposase
MAHHVMARGNGKQQIFINRADYQRFLDLLEASSRRFRVECHAYCLMPTHFHLTLRPGPHPVSRMMQQLNGAYAQYFNWRHRHVGHVMQGRFKGLIVEGDDYLLRLLRYVMQNPVAARLAKVPSAWRWSSYRATAGLAPVPSFLSVGAVWSMFDGTDSRRAQQRFADFVAIPEVTAPLLAAVFFGSSEFGRALSSKLAPTRSISEFTYRERFADRPPIGALFPEGQDELARARAMQDAFSRHAYTLREIANVLRCHPSTVWRRVRRPAERTHQMIQLLESLRA